MSQTEEWDDDWEPTEEDLQYFKDKLLVLRTEVTERLQNTLAEVTDNGDQPADELDQAERLTAQVSAMRIADKNQKLLRQIERALRKFETDEYGLCEGTGEMISRKRLELRPWTRYSIAHKEALERKKGRR